MRMEPKHNSNSLGKQQKILQWLLLTVFVLIGIHVWVRMPQGLCCHVSVTLIESNNGGRAPLWHELIHDIVESVLAGSIGACCKGHRRDSTSLRALSVCLSVWRRKHTTQSAQGVHQGHLSPNLGSRSTREAIWQVEWDLFRKRENYFQSAWAIKDLNTKESKHISENPELYYIVTIWEDHATLTLRIYLSMICFTCLYNGPDTKPVVNAYSQRKVPRSRRL